MAEEDDDYDELDDDLEAALEEDDIDQGPGLPQGPLPGQAHANNRLSEEPRGEFEELRPADASEHEDSPQDAGDATPDQARIDQAKMRETVMAMMTERQLDQYEAYRRSSLNKRSMRKLLQAVTGQSPNMASSGNVVIVLCGVAKMFVGELVEQARLLAAEQEHFGPLQPRHIHQAYQALEATEKSAQRCSKRRRL